ncbi:MAG: polysaccharide biosynthesis C-terminal domain-containing protein [Gammaproteobacteria bacterium]|nr:polysaccharide biosynthesis C-terminal domain-containing protein [Gammaproteobacteria bacterium]
MAHQSVSQLLRGSLATLIINGISALSVFGLQLLLARLLGHDNYSDYAYAFTALTLLSVFGVVGMDVAAQRFISSYQSLSEWALLKGFLKRSIQLTIFASVIAALSLTAAVIAFRQPIGEKLSDTILIAGLTLPFSSLLLLGVSILRGLKKPIIASVPRLIVRPMCLIIVVGLALINNVRGVTGSVAMLFELGVTLVALTVAILSITKYVPGQLQSTGMEFLTKRWISVSIPLFSIGCFQLIIRSADILIIGYSLETKLAGSYYAASRVAQLAAFGLMAINGVLPALIAGHFAKEERSHLQELVSYAAIATFVFSFFTTVIILLFDRQILVLFGVEFTEAAPALRILAVGQLINAMTGSVSVLLAMTGHQRIMLMVMSVAMICHLLMCAILIPQFGIIGGAIATSITVAAANIVLVTYCIEALSIDPSLFRFFKSQSSS